MDGKNYKITFGPDGCEIPGLELVELHDDIDNLSVTKSETFEPSKIVIVGGADVGKGRIRGIQTSLIAALLAERGHDVVMMDCNQMPKPKAPDVFFMEESTRFTPPKRRPKKKVDFCSPKGLKALFLDRRSIPWLMS